MTDQKKINKGFLKYLFAGMVIVTFFLLTYVSRTPGQSSLIESVIEKAEDYLERGQ